MVVELPAAAEAVYGRFVGPPSRAELERFFFLDDIDRRLVDKRRGDRNRVGFALQLGTVRFLGTFLADPTDVPTEVVDYVAAQVGAADASGLKGYLSRRPTRFEHVVEISQAYCYRDFADAENELEHWLDDRVWTTGEGPRALFEGAVLWLRERLVLLPDMTRLTRLVARVREATMQRLWDTVAAMVTPAQARTLEALLEVPDGTRTSDLERLRTGPTTVSGKAMAAALDRVAELAAMDLGSLDLDAVPHRRVVELAVGAWPARRRRCGGIAPPASWPHCWPPSCTSRPGPSTTRWSCSTCSWSTTSWPGPSASRAPLGPDRSSCCTSRSARATRRAPVPGHGGGRRGVLLIAAVGALAWANSPWSGSYRALWSTDVSLSFGRYVLVEDLRHWVNDALMAVLFFVVGLEIKRELVHGDLRDPRVAAMPAIAAAGGMAVPALLYLLVTAGGAGAHGWGIPMATDIAFAIGVVALLGPRVPATLKLFLLTLAIVDDIGAIVVIAVFYASDVKPELLFIAAGLITVMVCLRSIGIVWMAPYVVLGAGVWLATQASGIHATIAGVMPGLLAPAQPLIAGTVARQWANHLSDEPGPAELDAMTRLAKTAVSPAERLEHLLHPWTSFLVVPLFALANAGVELRGDSFDGPGAAKVTVGVVLGLVVGKTLGITAAAWLAVRTGLGRLPEGATWPMLVGVAAVAGIGFTVALFIAELAFVPGSLQDAAKIGVLGASTLAAAIGAAVLRRACRTSPADSGGSETA